jgi:uncharacterized membrane protein YjjP (DUF1212 family)
MNEELKTRLNKYLDTLEQSLATGTDFVSDQAPLVVQEFLAWEFWTSFVFAVLFMLFSVAVVVATVKLARVTTEDVEEKAALYCIGTVVWFVPTLLLVVNLMDAAKVHMAPRVYLLEHIAELVR